MDSMEVSGASDSGSIPDAATFYKPFCIDNQYIRLVLHRAGETIGGISGLLAIMFRPILSLR